MKLFSARSFRLRRRFPLTVATGIMIGAFSCNSFAAPVGNLGPNVRTDWVNDLRVVTGMRVQGRDKAIANTALFDEGDYLFDVGDVVTKRVDVNSGFNFKYTPPEANWLSSLGFRVAGNAFHDFSYQDRAEACRPGTVKDVLGFGTEVSYCDSRVLAYSSGKRNSKAQERNYQDAEFTEAFVFSNFLISERTINIRIGRHALYWGESLFNPFLGVSYSMGPVDINRATTVPGVQAQDVFLPINQVSGTIGISDTLAMVFQVPLEWKQVRVQEGGTYLSPADPFFDAPDQFFATVLPAAALGGTCPDGSAGPACPITLKHLPDQRGNNHGAYGAGLRWNPEFMDGGQLSAYYREFGDIVPWVGTPTPAGAPFPAGYRLTYGKNSRLMALTGSIKVFGISFGSDVVYSPNRMLNNASIASLDGQGPRGEAWSGVLNGIYVGAPVSLAGIKLFDTYSVTAEANWTYLQKVTEHLDLFKKVDSAACQGDLDAAAGALGVPSPGKAGTRDGCASRYSVGASIQFAPTWYQVWPGIDLNGSIVYDRGIKNTSPVYLGGFEGAASGSVGVGANFYSLWSATLAYNFYDTQLHKILNNAGEPVVVAFNGLGTTADRDWISLTLKYSF